MIRTIIIFGTLGAAILLLFQLQYWSLFTVGGLEHLYPVISGALFLVLGIVFSRYFFIQQKRKKIKGAQSLLSHQEWRVLQLISKGLSNKEIGQELYIAETTVKSHVSNILEKLGAKRRTEAVKIARELSIIED